MLYLLKNLDIQQVNYLMVDLRRHQLRQARRSSTFQVIRSSIATTTWSRYRLMDMITTYLQHLDRHLDAFHESRREDHHRCIHGIETPKEQRTSYLLHLLLTRSYLMFHSTWTYLRAARRRS